jgi:iron-sulfur cluster insertion protein
MNITDSAVAKLQEIIAEEKNPNIKLRVFVQGGGCSGFQYGFTLDEDQQADDFDFEFNEIKVLVDAMSMQYLEGATVNYRDDLHGSAFTIDNPNAASTCGCGSSFSV